MQLISLTCGSSTLLTIRLSKQKLSKLGNLFSSALLIFHETDMATVNLITVALAADSKVGESSSDAHATLNETLGMLTKADGIRKIQYGTQEENPDVLRFFNSEYQYMYLLLTATTPYQ